jgi:hypothetical protein
VGTLAWPAVRLAEVIIRRHGVRGRKIDWGPNGNDLNDAGGGQSGCKMSSVLAVKQGNLG